jgi:amino acid permease
MINTLNASYWLEIWIVSILNYEVECKGGENMFSSLKTYTEILEVRRIVLLLMCVFCVCSSCIYSVAIGDNLHTNC